MAPLRIKDFKLLSKYKNDPVLVDMTSQTGREEAKTTMSLSESKFLDKYYRGHEPIDVEIATGRKFGNVPGREAPNVINTRPPLHDVPCGRAEVHGDAVYNERRRAVSPRVYERVVDFHTMLGRDEGQIAGYTDPTNTLTRDLDFFPREKSAILRMEREREREREREKAAEKEKAGEKGKRAGSRASLRSRSSLRPSSRSTVQQFPRPSTAPTRPASRNYFPPSSSTQRRLGGGVVCGVLLDGLDEGVAKGVEERGDPLEVHVKGVDMERCTSRQTHRCPTDIFELSAVDQTYDPNFDVTDPHVYSVDLKKATGRERDLGKYIHPEPLDKYYDVQYTQVDKRPQTAPAMERQAPRERRNPFREHVSNTMTRIERSLSQTSRTFADHRSGLASSYRWSEDQRSMDRVASTVPERERVKIARERPGSKAAQRRTRSSLGTLRFSGLSDRQPLATRSSLHENRQHRDDVLRSADAALAHVKASMRRAGLLKERREEKKPSVVERAAVARRRIKQLEDELGSNGDDSADDDIL